MANVVFSPIAELVFGEMGLAAQAWSRRMLSAAGPGARYGAGDQVSLQRKVWRRCRELMALPRRIGPRTITSAYLRGTVKHGTWIAGLDWLDGQGDEEIDWNDNAAAVKNEPADGS